MPIRTEHSLRHRFLWALIGVSGLLLASFGVALGLFVDVLEHELLERVLTMELDGMPARVSAEGAATPGEPVAGVRHWTVPAADQQGLPAPLRRMPEGQREIEWDDGTDVMAAKRVTDGYVHAVVLDIGNVERLEQRLVHIGIATAIIAFLLSLVLAARLSRAALRPISTLVERIRTLDPTRPGPLLDTGIRTTEAREIAKAMDGYQARIARLLERERSLTDDISHELRTPTAVITTASELLLEDQTVVGPARERVGRVARAARRTMSVVDALLFLGRGESSDAPVAVDLCEVVDDIVQAYRPLAQAKGIELLAECGDEQWVTAPSEAAAIVLRNLIENAIRFTDHGHVRVTLEPGRLGVEDTGVGLAGVDRERIFERGYRSDSSRGSGLGLDLIRRVCDRVGWRVSAHQRSEGGSRFEIAMGPPTDGPGPTPAVSAT